MAYSRNRPTIALIVSLFFLLYSILMADLWVLLYALVLVPIITVFYDVVFEPLKWHDGTTPLEGKDFAFSKNLNSKMPGNIPPPYPNGWYMILLSHDLAPGEVKTVQFMGQDVVAWRGLEDKTVHVTDAYCTHLGAHLGEGGTVVGNRIRCPFHAWEFGGSGNCERIPYSESSPIPKNSNIKSWKVMETNNFIMIHFHADNEEPSWIPVELPEINNGDFKYHGRSEHIMRCHIQEIPENGPDFVHLNVVHTTVSHFDVPGTTHVWEGTWNPDPHDKHIAHVRVDHKLSFLGWRIELMNRPVIVRQIGPGLVWLELDSIFGKWVVTQAVTPVSPGRVRLHHSIYSNLSRVATKFIFYTTIFQVEQDIPIWNNKTFQKQPTLLKEDGPISKFRRWYSQFYSESSDKVWKQRDANIDW